MNPIRTTLAALLATAALAVAAPAQADEWGPWNITDPADVCVRADFPISRSGWPVHKAVENWNAVQDAVTFRVGYGLDCADVLIHRGGTEPGTCGRTDFIRLWDQASHDNVTVSFAGADVYLSDDCSPVRTTRKWVLAHELGHAIGLIHGTADDSVMSASYLADVYKGVPGATDVANVAALYGG